MVIKNGQMEDNAVAMVTMYIKTITSLFSVISAFLMELFCRVHISCDVFFIHYQVEVTGID